MVVQGLCRLMKVLIFFKDSVSLIFLFFKCFSVQIFESFKSDIFVQGKATTSTSVAASRGGGGACGAFSPSGRLCPHLPQSPHQKEKMAKNISAIFGKFLNFWPPPKPHFASSISPQEILWCCYCQYLFAKGNELAQYNKKNIAYKFEDRFLKMVSSSM